MENQYEFIEYVGSGTSGKVSKYLHKSKNENFAIKSIVLKKDPHIEQCKRLYREISILKHLNSHFALSLLDIYKNCENEQLEVWLVLPFMEFTLKILIKEYRLQYEQIIQIMYQLLMGLNYLYDSGIIHRDLKPSNIGINKDMSLKILDFGLARDRKDDLTEYVVTRWYRPLEVFCTSHYTISVDIWSVGCIIVELFTNKVLFQGKDQIDQSKRILEVMGWPSTEMLDKFDNNTVLGLGLFKKFAAESNQLMRIIQKPIEKSCESGAHQDCPSYVIDLIFKILELDPDKRITPMEALKSELFTKSSSFISSYIESGTAREFKMNFLSDNNDVEFWKGEILKEIESFIPRN